MKQLDLSKTIFELISQYPELTDTMEKLGFKNITKPGMLETVGRVMTLKKGSLMKNIDMDIIKKELVDQGYELKE
jgi:hypothetical protein